MGKKRPSWKQYLGIGKDDKWKSGKDYRDAKRYWKNGRLQARNPAGYEDFKRREKDYLDNKGKGKGERKDKPEEYSYGGRGSGEFEDIRTSLRDDADKGKAAAAEFRNKQPPGQENRDLIRDLRAKRGSGLGTNPNTKPTDFSAAQQNIAKTLGIKTVNSQKDLRQVQDYNANQTRTDYSGSMKPVSFTKDDSNIGKLLGIKNLDSVNDLRRINDARRAAEAIGIQNIDSQNDVKQINSWLSANPTAPKVPAPGSGTSTQPTPMQVNEPTLQDLLIGQQTQFETQIAGLQQGYDDQISALTGQLGQANNAYAAAQQQMQAQLQSATAAAQAAEQRAANMRNAFVPQANPSAMSVAYGDQRKTNRNQANNQLSDLTIMSGLGTASNPLAGLQLA